MSHGLFAAFALLAPVGRLMHRFHAGRVARAPVSAGSVRHAAAPAAPARRDASHPPGATSLATGRRLRAPLRVVRIVESGQASALAGRILMSGRMADVCAELDRMVEREARLHAGA